MKDERRQLRGANVHPTAVPLIVLFSVSLLALASCGGEAQRSDAPAAPAPAAAAPADQARPPAPAAPPPTASAPSGQGSCTTIGYTDGLSIELRPQAARGALTGLVRWPIARLVALSRTQMLRQQAPPAGVAFDHAGAQSGAGRG
jgi:hypothetical protein